MAISEPQDNVCTEVGAWDAVTFAEKKVKLLPLW